MLTRKIIVGMIMAVLATAASATDRLVPSQYSTIAAGINAAQSGDTVIVADGTYAGGGNRWIRFYGKAITVRSQNGPDACIIDLENAGWAFMFDRSESANSILDGFTITKSGSGNGAILCDHTSPTIRNCVIRETGRSIKCSSNAKPTISNCVISENSGIGIWCSSSSDPTISNCVISENSGFGISCSWGTAVIDNCIIANNGDRGINHSSPEELTVTNCTIVGHEQGIRCGDAITATITNCVIWDNFPNEIYVQSSDADVTVKYCDVKDGEEGVSAPNDALDWGPGNIDADPLFVDADSGDFHLQFYSPCVDTGDPNEPTDPNATDIDGQPRANGVSVDIGADEAGSVWYVYADANGAGDGSSWEDAFTVIQDAIDAASDLHDDLIAVAEGTYYESVDFGGKPITVKKTTLYSLADAVIDANDSDANTVTFDSGEDENSVLTGFTLTGGKYGAYCSNSSAPKIINCVIKANSYCAVYLSGAGSAELRNDTVVDNSTAGIYVASGNEPNITNCIIWNNGDDLYGCSATYSCIEDGDSGTGNISSDPLFVDPQSGDYHLDTNSPCIDAGDPNTSPNGEVDIYDGPRVQGACVDIGADEADPNIWIDPNTLSLTLYEGETKTKGLTIGNSGKTDLYFNIWPSDAEALNKLLIAGEQGDEAPGGQSAFSKKMSVLEYDFEEPIVTRSGEYDRLVMEGLDDYNEVGAPIVPMKTVRAAIPFGKEVVHTELDVVEQHHLKGKYNLSPGQKDYPISYTGRIEPNEPDPAIYGSNKPWPGVYYKDPTVQSKRGYQLYFARLYPVQYYPKSGRVSYTSKLRLTIKLADKTKRIVLRPSKKLKSHLAKEVDNPEALATYPSGFEIKSMMEGGRSMSLEGGPYEYVIITNEELLHTAPEPWDFQKLRDSKVARGIPATIVTTEWIYDNYDGNRPDGGEDNQTRIRNFLIDAYNDWSTEYVLLGGASPIIPVRKFEGSPCDMYYGCVEPNECTFDFDADGTYGEPSDGVGGNEVDLLAEIYVGRAAVETVGEVSNFVRKTLTYGSLLGETEYFPLVSMVAGDGFYTSLEPIRGHFENHTQDDFYDFDTSNYLYEWIYDWPVADFIDLMNNGVHVIDHIAHSSSGCIGKLCKGHLSSLTNSDYFFIYSMGCSPGAFDYKDCFAEVVTTMGKGAFSAIMNSREGYTGTSSKFNRRFWDAVLKERIMEIGKANQYSKESGTIPPSVFGRDIYWRLNVFGDPEQQFLFGQEIDSAWVGANPASGTVSDHNSLVIDVNFNALTLPAGTYEGEIITTCNDHINPTTIIPVTMTVLQATPAVTPYDSFVTARLGQKASFKPERITYTVTNNGPTSISWAASNTKDWLDIEPNNGALDPNEAVDVNVCVNLNAYNLSKGAYYDTITFTNTADSNTHERGVDLRFTNDYFTEVFDSNDLDIENQILTFYPDGSDSFYGVCRQNATEFPTDPDGGEPITFDDPLNVAPAYYWWSSISLTGDAQVSFYGTSYDSFLVSGNGCIGFGSGWVLPGLADLTSHFNLPKQIAALWYPLDPWGGGSVSYKQLSDRVAVTFEDVPEWDYPDNLFSFQVEMFFDGRIRITHLNLDLFDQDEDWDVLVGLSEGTGVPDLFTESDLSDYGSSCPGVQNIDKNIWYMFIQSAIDDANDGNDIVVYPGTYYENIDFKGKSITLRSSDPNDWEVVDATIIDANGSGNVVTFNTSEDANSVLKGFKITGASRGIYCNGASPTIADCKITGNGTSYYGGGMYNRSGSSPTVTHCIFSNNTAEDGAGMCNKSGSSPTVVNCVFSGNTAVEDDGGGMYNHESSPTVINCVFYDNTATDDDGGAMWNDESSPTIINCTFFENYAGDHAGGMYSRDDSYPTVTNCIFWDNDAAHSGEEIYNSDSGPTFSYCDIEGGLNGSKCGGDDSTDGGGNIDEDPEFEDEDDPDGADDKWATSDDGLALDSSSDCIDEGDDGAVPEWVTTDIKGDDRIIDGDVDMGAYEYDD